MVYIFNKLKNVFLKITGYNSVLHKLPDKTTAGQTNDRHDHGIEKLVTS